MSQRRGCRGKLGGKVQPTTDPSRSAHRACPLGRTPRRGMAGGFGNAAFSGFAFAVRVGLLLGDARHRARAFCAHPRGWRGGWRQAGRRETGVSASGSADPSAVAPLDRSAGRRVFAYRRVLRAAERSCVQDHQSHSDRLSNPPHRSAASARNPAGAAHAATAGPAVGGQSLRAAGFAAGARPAGEVESRSAARGPNAAGVFDCGLATDATRDAAARRGSRARRSGERIPQSGRVLSDDGAASTGGGGCYRARLCRSARAAHVGPDHHREYGQRPARCRCAGTGEGGIRALSAEPRRWPTREFVLCVSRAVSIEELMGPLIRRADASIGAFYRQHCINQSAAAASADNIISRHSRGEAYVSRCQISHHGGCQGRSRR
jgi:hypothetical protein